MRGGGSGDVVVRIDVLELLREGGVVPFEGCESFGVVVGRGRGRRESGEIVSEGIVRGGGDRCWAGGLERSPRVVLRKREQRTRSAGEIKVEAARDRRLDSHRLPMSSSSDPSCRRRESERAANGRTKTRQSIASLRASRSRLTVGWLSEKAFVLELTLWNVDED